MRLYLLLLIVIAALATNSRVRSQNVLGHPFWSIGPKIGYTFGEGGGVSGGFEISYFPNSNPFGAFTLDVTGWPPASTAIHFGVEAWYYVGLDIGPTLFLRKDEAARIGMSAIVWDGLLFYPYYELQLPFDGKVFHSVGGYLKFPLGDSRDNSGFRVG